MPSIERRAYPRLHLELSTLVLQDRCVEADRAQIRDLSWSGAFLAMPTAAILGRRVKLSFHVPSVLGEVQLDAAITRKGTDGVAVQFEQLNAHAELALRELLGSRAPPREEITEKTLPFTGLAPAANDTPPFVQAAPSTLRSTIQRLFRRVG